MAKDTTYSVAVDGGRLVYFDKWPHGDKFLAFRTMHQSAKTGLGDFMTARQEILNDVRLTDAGKDEKIDALAKEFDQVRRNFTNNAVAGRTKALDQEIADLRGGRPREPTDVAGALFDRELRAAYRALEGQEKIAMNARLRDGQFNQVAAALLRVPEALSGVHGELYEILGTTSVDPKNAGRMAELNEERAAIKLAETSMETASREVDRVASNAPAIVKARVDEALRREGLQKKGPRQVEPYQEPEPDEAALKALTDSTSKKDTAAKDTATKDAAAKGAEAA